MSEEVFFALWNGLPFVLVGLFIGYAFFRRRDP